VPLSFVIFYICRGGNELNLLIIEIIIAILLMGTVLADLCYWSIDIVLTTHSVILISFAYRIFGFPKTDELPINKLRQVEVSDLAAHGILVQFTTNKTYWVFATDIMKIADFLDELTLKVPKTCKVYDINM